MICCFIIETCEEFGLFDFFEYLDVLTDDLGSLNFIVVFDMGGGDYEYVWVTDVLRGLLAGILSV